MKLMHLPDGPGWSPDGGYFWVKGDTLDWEDGATWDMNDGCVIRVGFGPYECENFSAWTDERRAAALAAAAERREQIMRDIERHVLPDGGTLVDGEDYDALHAACRALLNRYLALVNSGDAGNWNPEEEPEVIAVRRALSK